VLAGGAQKSENHGELMADVLDADRARPWLLLSPALVTIVLLVVIPMGIIFVYSFYLFVAPGIDKAAFQFANWSEFFTDSYYHVALWKTLRISVIATVACALMGYVPAYYIATTDFKHKWLLMLLLILPFWVSFIIRTYSWIHVLGKQGFVNMVLMKLGIIDAPLTLLYTEGSVVMGMIHFLLPYMVLNIYVSLEGIDKNLVSAARTLGAKPWQSFLEVTLPLSLPGLAAGSLLCFVLSAGTFVTPQILGGTRDYMFGNLIFDALMDELNWPMGAALSFVMLVMLGTIVIVYNRIMGLSQVYSSFK
jgi:spermidine/putrescine transport system permease protein